MHQAGDEIQWPVGTQPVGGDLQPRQVPALDAVQETGPPVHLPFVKAFWPAQIRQTPGAPVDLRQQCDALGELIAQSWAGGRVTVERFRPPAVDVHRRPAVDEAHQIERAPEDLGIGADSDRLRVGDVGAVEGFDDAPLPQDALVAVRGCAGRWHPQHAAGVTAGDLVDDVLGTAGQKSGVERLSRAGQRRVVHPCRQPAGVERLGHRLPTSCSR